MVIGFVGLPGTAKTYGMTSEALDFWYKIMKKPFPFDDEGEVYATYHIWTSFDFPDGSGCVCFSCNYVPKIKDFKKIRRGMLLIDEINLKFPARYWKNFDANLLYFWSQTRKHGLDIFWSSQNFKRPDTVIREITNYVWYCRFGMFSAIRRNARRMKLYQPEDLNESGVPKEKASIIDRKRFSLSPKVWNCFDTFEMIFMDEEYTKGRVED